MKFNLLFFTALLFIFKPTYGDEFSISITGSFSGKAESWKNNLAVTLNRASSIKLSDYNTIRPSTGGKRIMLYFDLDKNTKGAELCAFIYEKSTVLKKSSTSGFFNITLDEFPTIHQNGNIKITIPIMYLDSLPYKIWNKYNEA